MSYKALIGAKWPRRLLLLVVVALLSIPSNLSAAVINIPYFDALQARLIKDGFDKKWIHRLYNRPGVAFETIGVALFFQHRESRLNYKQFTDGPDVAKGKKYMKRRREALAAAEKQYGVDGAVITAILLVETRLGTYLGNRSVFNSLSTMAALKDPVVRRAFWRKIPKKKRLLHGKFQKKSTKKSGWAYRELKALLKYAAREGLDPLKLKGSYAGAMGIPQFMPSKALALGKDGNGDLRIDLFNHDDAIISVANYLKKFGWRVDLPRKKAYKVLLRYNYSRPYANTVLKAAELLKG
ncbi:MAG: lytic murein transglycosylase [Desulfobacterales bacterium]|nr:lytic murein transglycosylase [Desulfobacterales bacterium]